MGKDFSLADVVAFRNAVDLNQVDPDHQEVEPVHMEGSPVINERVLTLDPLHAAFGNNAAGIADVLTMAVTDGLKRMVALTAAIAGGDNSAALDLVHTMKGTSGNLGAFEVSEDAAALERALRGASRGEIGACHAKLASAFERFANAVERYQEER